MFQASSPWVTFFRAVKRIFIRFNLKLFLSSQLELKVAPSNLPAPVPGVAPTPDDLLAPAKKAGSGGSSSEPLFKSFLQRVTSKFDNYVKMRVRGCS